MSSSSSLVYTIVDSFTESIFCGNPAAVIILEQNHGHRSSFLQSIANEFNLSETAFATPRNAETYDLRWFTPSKEVPLCGHATLATAFVLFSQRHEMDLIVFETLSGPLRCVRTSDGRIEMDFPSCLLTAVEIDSAAHAEVVRGVVASCQELSHRSIVRVHTGDLGLVIQLQSETELDRLTIDDSVLMSLSKGLVIYTQSSQDPSTDIVSRVFAPAYGVSEDPVTGSAQCLLAPFWFDDPSIALVPNAVGETVLRSRQVSRRGGDIDVLYNRESRRIRLRGHAVKSMQGTLYC